MIKVTFTDEIEIITSTEHLYQWDVGQVLEIEGLDDIGTPKIHFGVKGDTTGYSVQSQLVDGKLCCAIPDVTLQSGKQIIAYVYVSAGASKYTERVILIPVVERNRPSDYAPVNMANVTETQSFFDNLVGRVEGLEERVPISFWIGTEELYSELNNKQGGCLYITTDEYINKVLYEGEALKGSDILADLTGYSLFAITIHSMVTDVTVLCYRTTRASFGDEVVSGFSSVFYSGSKDYYAKFQSKITNAGLFEIDFKLTDTVDFANSESNYAQSVTKITGII